MPLQPLGPLVNAIMIVLAVVLNINPNLRQIIIYSNILILIFNLLPIYPLDGGRIIKGLLTLKYGEANAEKLVNMMSNAILIMLTVVSSILVIYLQNIAIFFVIMYLWVVVIKENRRYRTKKKVYDVIKEQTVKSY